MKICPCCNQEFSKPNKTFCSYSCFQQSITKPLPPKQDLESLVWEFPLIKISKLYNVSPYTVRKWCDTHNIILPQPGYWFVKTNKGTRGQKSVLF